MPGHLQSGRIGLQDLPLPVHQDQAVGQLLEYGRGQSRPLAPQPGSIFFLNGHQPLLNGIPNGHKPRLNGHRPLRRREFRLIST